MRTIYLLRHGETVWNTENRLQGHKDSPLTSRGLLQARRNGQILESLMSGKPVRLFSSPLGRARETAGIIAMHLGIEPAGITFDHRLREFSYGRWEGLTRQEIRDGHRDAFEKRNADRWNTGPPDGESYREVAVRVKTFLDELEDELAVVVCHGGTSKVVRGVHGDLSPEQMYQLDVSHESIFVLHSGGVITNAAECESDQGRVSPETMK